MLPARWAVRVLTRLTDLLARARRRAMPAEYAALELGTASWVSYALAAFCELGIADALRTGKQTPAQLAQSGCGTEDFLERLLRTLSAYDVVTYRRGAYELGRIGSVLGGPDGVGAMIRYANAEWHALPYALLARAARSREPAFSLVHGTPLFAYVARHPDAAAKFHEGMRAMNRLYAEAFARAYDFSGVPSLVDVGGGTGALAAAVRARFPQVQTTVFELPHVPAAHAQSGVAYVEGDIFRQSPPAAACYVLSHVLHDWDDEHAGRILRNVAAAMNRDSRLLVYELIAEPPGNRWSQDRLSDLEMLAMLGGRERTLDAFDALFRRAGLCRKRVLRAPAPEAVIECVLA